MNEQRASQWISKVKQSGAADKVRGWRDAARVRLSSAKDRARTASRPEPDATAPQKVIRELRTLTDQGKHAEATKLAEQHLAEYSGDIAFVKQARTTFTKAGAMTLHLEATRMQRKLDPHPKWIDREALIAGRWNETQPDFWPKIDGEPTKLEPSSDKKILHLLKISLPYRQSGYSVRSKYSLEGQLAVGLEPVAVTEYGFPRSVGVDDAPSSEEIDGITYHRLDPGADYDLKGPWDKYLTDFANAAAPIVAAERPALIHVHSGHRGYDTALVGIALGRHFGIPVVYEVRGFFEALWTSDTDWAEQAETYERRRATENRCMAAADHVVTLSESMRSDIVSRGISADKVSVVPNGVNIDSFQPRERSAELVARYGLEGVFTFGYVSNVDHYREGQEALIEAAVELRKRGITATAMIIGDGKRRELLEKLAAERDAGDAVIFTGRVPHDEVLDYYALLDVFVIPRVPERAARLVTPLKPFEAMAAGIPLVVSDLEALREITGDGARGRYFPAEDAVGLADVLADLHANPAERQAMSMKAREWVVAERQWSNNGQRYADIYDRVRRAK